MKTIIAGGRNFNDSKLFEDSMSQFDNISEVVCGGAKGADALGKTWAENNNINVKMFPANWKKYGRGAGPIRNKEMATYADMLIIFWDGKSKGSKSMISLAKKQNLIVHVINY